MKAGTIKTLVSDKGYGFIKTSGDDVFFHSSSVAGRRFDDLHIGQDVEFTEEQGPKGARAVTVVPL